MKSSLTKVNSGQRAHRIEQIKFIKCLILLLLQQDNVKTQAVRRQMGGEAEIVKYVLYVCYEVHFHKGACRL